MKASAFTVFLIASLLAACGGGSTGLAPSSNATCGPPPPTSAPWLALVYPAPQAQHVSISVGIAVFAGDVASVYGTGKIALQSASGGVVPVGAFTAAPSPLPTPNATPTGATGAVPYIAAPLPTLSPATTYNVRFTYTDYSNVAPSCTQSVTRALGNFTTQ